MSNHIQRLEHISNSPDNITEKTAQEFISIMQKHYPNGSWKTAPEEVKASITAFETYLENHIHEPWAKEKFDNFQNFKQARGVLASSIRPKARPANLNTNPTTSVSNNFKTIDIPQFKDAIQKLQGKLIQKGYIANTLPGGSDSKDGIAGQTTYESTIAYMTANPKDFQKSLNTLYGQALDIDGVIGPKTLKVLKDCTGMEITPALLAGSIIVEAAKDKRKDYEILKSKTIAELVKQLHSLGNTEKERETANNILLVISKKLREKNTLARYDTQTKKWGLATNEGKSVTNSYNFSEAELQFIAFSGSISDTAGVKGVESSPEITNIFDSLTEKFEIKHNSGRILVYNDLLDDPSGHIDANEKQQNRDDFLKDITKHIATLEAENADSTTPIHTKQENTIWLTRLYLLQTKFSSPNAIDAQVEQNVTIAASTNQVNKFIADAASNRPGSIAKGIADGTFVDDILKSGLAPAAIVVGIVGMFIALPKWLKYPTYTFIAALVLNGPYKKLAKKWGLDKQIAEALGEGSHSPNQATTGPGTIPSAIDEFFARVPGVDKQFRYGYAIIRKEHDEHDAGQGKNTFPESKLENIFEVAVFTPKFMDASIAELEAAKSNPDLLFQGTRDLMGGASDHELELFISFLLKAKQTNDTNARDILCDGVFDITKVPTPKYSEHSDTFNKEVFALVSSLSGVSGETQNSAGLKTTRAQVDTILSTTLPNFINFQDTSTTEVGGIIKKLTTLKGESSVNTKDKDNIEKIITLYNSMKQGLTIAGEVKEILAEGEAITNPTPGKNALSAAYNGVSDGLAWVSGMPISIMGKIEGVTVDQIDQIITKLYALKTKYSTSAAWNVIETPIMKEISNLQQKKAFLLSNQALNTIDPKQKGVFESAATTALTASITANPDAFQSELDKLEANIEVIKNPQTSTKGYFEIFSQNSKALKSLQNIIRANAGDVSTQAERIYNAAINDYRTNINAHANQRQSEINDVATCLAGANITALELDTLTEKYEALRDDLIRDGLMIQARHLAYTWGLTVNGQDTDSIDLINVIQDNLNKIDPSNKITLLMNTAESQLDAIKQVLTTKGISVAQNIGFDTAKLSEEDASVFAAYANAKQAEIDAIPDDTAAQQAAKSQAQNKFNQFTSKYIAALSTKAAAATDLDALGNIVIEYETLDGVKRGKDEFDAAIEAVMKRELLEIPMTDVGDKIEGNLISIKNTLETKYKSNTAVWNMILNKFSTSISGKLSDFIGVLDEIIQTETDINISNTLKSERRAILGIVGEEKLYQLSSWIKNKSSSIGEYLAALF